MNFYPFSIKMVNYNDYILNVKPVGICGINHPGNDAIPFLHISRVDLKIFY